MGGMALKNLIQLALQIFNVQNIEHLKFQFLV